MPACFSGHYGAGLRKLRKKWTGKTTVLLFGWPELLLWFWLAIDYSREPQFSYCKMKLVIPLGKLHGSDRYLVFLMNVTKFKWRENKVWNNNEFSLYQEACSIWLCRVPWFSYWNKLISLHCFSLLTWEPEPLRQISFQLCIKYWEQNQFCVVTELLHLFPYTAGISFSLLSTH